MKVLENFINSLIDQIYATINIITKYHLYVDSLKLYDYVAQYFQYITLNNQL